MPYTTPTHPSCPAAAVKHKVSESSPPTVLSLHNLSGSTSQTLSNTSTCTCHCPTQHQVLPGSPPQGSEPKSPGAAFSRPQDHISSTFKHTDTDIATVCASISTLAATPALMLEKCCLFQASASWLMNFLLLFYTQQILGRVTYSLIDC